MKVAIVGAGALGSLFAALLALAGRPEDEVWLVGGSSSQPHLEAIAKEGLRLELAPNIAQPWKRPTQLGPGDTFLIKNLKLASRPEQVNRPVDLVIVLVKSYRTVEAAEQTSAILGSAGLALTLQNGLGNAEQLAAKLGEERVAQGVTSLGAILVEPGRIRFTGLGQTALGLSPVLSQAKLELLKDLGQLLVGLNLSVELSQEVAALVWAKLVVNCAINPLTALLECTNGQLLERPAALELMDAAAVETARIAQASGVTLPYPVEQAHLQARRVAELTATNISSMLTDVRRGRPTEIEAINGAVDRVATNLGLAAPVNRTLYLLIKALVWKSES